MRRTVAFAVVLACGCVARVAQAQEQVTQPDTVQPYKLTLEPSEPSVYALPTPPGENDGLNSGGAHIDMEVRYMTEYIYRGLDISHYINREGESRDNNANFQYDGKLSFDLGKFPHPFVGAFVNVLDSDPVSTFQEVRPFVGADWTIRPVTIGAGLTTYLYPDRDPINTSELWGRITLDDAAILRRDDPILSPYIFGAYDYDLYNGWYFEAGVTHEFAIEKTGLTLIASGSVGAALGHQEFAGPAGHATGLHHWQIGLEARYSLNTLFNFPRRYGEWTINGYLNYSDGISDRLNGDDHLWGGVGIQFSY